MHGQRSSPAQGRRGGPRVAWAVLAVVVAATTTAATRVSGTGGWTWPTVRTTTTSLTPTTRATTTTTPTTTSAPATTVPAATPSGVPMPTGDLPGWRQIFADDFVQNVPLGSFPQATSGRWWAYPDGWKDTSKVGTYAPSKVVSVQNGVMNLWLHSENGVPLVAAPVPRIAGAPSNNGQLYGRYSVRFRADPLPGYKTAWLLWPDSEQWPRDGEIDFPEGNLNGRICAFVHHQGGTSPYDQTATCVNASYAGWHTATIEWTAAAVRFILDGVVIGTTTSRIPNTSMHWVLQTETVVGGTPPAPTTAGNVQIDWVTIYAPT